MDRMPDWRPVEPTGPDGPAANDVPAEQPAGSAGWRLLALAALSIGALGAGALALSAATPDGPLDLNLGPAVASTALPEPGSTPAASPSTAEIVVDVQGAVERPGLYRLTAGSRVGEAVAAAGGYSAAVDLDAAAQQLNLAERLADGAKVHVPRRGEPPAERPAQTSGGSAAAGGLIDLNTADQQQLESLPGIGPVTATKIIDARTEAPFASVDDLLARGVVGPATFEKIRELVSVAP